LRNYRIYESVTSSPVSGGLCASVKGLLKLLYSMFHERGGQVARMADRRGVYRVVVGRPERKTPLGRPRRRWEGAIKMDLQEVGWGHGLD
jgi:hypothetical protein